jgi:hypothetical protein
VLQTTNRGDRSVVANLKITVKTICYNQGAGVKLETWVDIGDGKGL